MSAEISSNKSVAMEYFASLTRGDVAGMSDCMTDDATWWIVPGTKFSGLHSKASFLRNIPALFEGTTGGLLLDFYDVTAQDNRVAIVAKGNLKFKDGRTYASNYNFLLTFREGKIVNGKEFLDALHVNEIFGAQ
ncbi:nuclear transport factor 2 family protein [Pseudomonas tolaasii]|uniref:nuclear transport factor 2 family protein n=1 Tax=Pseudomonas tolaasii TaxID=29442 RepID=UPI001C5F585D|nr:nuclear transport factor 2 family protein [Pseudomonas tolaasii]MBW4793242.1 nuclear transport factor 2 family protein [Pseudomonas tolaasii]